MKLILRTSCFALAIGLAGLSAFAANDLSGDGGKKHPHSAKPADAASQLKLPAGFKAMTVVEDMGVTRHLVVAPNGVIFVKLSDPKKLKNGGTPKEGVYRLEDTNGDGKPDKITNFGDYPGTGVAIKNGYLYASSNTDVYRYKMDGSFNVVNPDQPEKIVSGLADHNQHNSKSIVLDNNGNIYVNIGAYSNSCQVQDRSLESPGKMPCPILDSAGGIWQFKADQPNQNYNTGTHYATGLRNVVGLDWNMQTNSLFVMQHGRDNLATNWPKLWDNKQSAELPAECLYELHKGSNCGWPYIYYDPTQHKQMLAPEYGGDGKKGPEKEFQEPLVAFPAHLAPDGLVFYTGNQFPEKYKNGAFIAFHGSWNRAPEPQAGFFVVFVPFKDGKPSGNWEVFADNFSGGPDKTASGRVDYRPCGLAQGPDGSLYVTDDTKGTIWKISYNK
jgi:glucose/arabinose dehydrogenase